MGMSERHDSDRITVHHLALSGEPEKLDTLMFWGGAERFAMLTKEFFLPFGTGENPPWARESTCHPDEESLLRQDVESTIFHRICGRLHFSIQMD